MTDTVHAIMKSRIQSELEAILGSAIRLLSPTELDRFEGALQTAEGCLLVALKSIKGDTNDN